MTGLRAVWTRVGDGRSRGPLYHRLLRLQRHRPGPVVTFLCFEGSVIGAAVLSLAEVLPWSSVLLVPAAVAAVVKLHDVVVQATPAAGPSRLRAVGIAKVVGISRAIGIARVFGIARPASRPGVVRGVAPVPRAPQ